MNVNILQLSDRSHTEKVTLSVTAFVWSVQEEETHRDRSQVDLSGAEEEGNMTDRRLCGYLRVGLYKFVIKTR